MAEITTNVYDLLIPSPPALKEIVSISIAAQLWRQEINSHRIKNTLSQLNLQQDILCDDLMPRIPATTMPLIKKYVKQVGLSIKQWLKVHSDLNLFKTEIFNDFTDFVADFDGTIHYDKTARKMVLCERIDEMTRFKIACAYCFENEISRIWPSVSSHFNNTSNFYSGNRLFRYWIFRLKKQLYKLSGLGADGRRIEAQIFRDPLAFPSWSSFEYFWKLADVDTKIWYTSHFPDSYDGYYRYSLPKFSEIQLNEFVNRNGYKILVAFLYKHRSRYSAPYIMAIWTYIKHKFSADIFSRMVRKVIQKQYCFMSVFRKDTCCELWNTAPNDLKQRAIRDILLENGSLFAGCGHFDIVDEYPNMSMSDPVFLLTVLTDASAEDRIVFWNKYWRRLKSVMFTEQLAQLTSFCFGNDEDRIVEFKLNSLSVLQNIRTRCSKLLNNLHIEELDKLLNFCSPDEQTRKTIRRALLVEEFKFDRRNMPKVSSTFNDFINNAYDEEDLAAQFKTQLLSSPATIITFIKHSRSCNVSFIDILAPSQQAARELKRLYIVPLMRQKFSGSSGRTDEDVFSNFISECLDVDNEDVTRGRNCPRCNSMRIERLRLQW